MEYPATTATVETLPNGLTLILDPDPAAPVVSTQVWVESGSMHEDRMLGTGLSHFLEHMVFKGTRDFSADELADTVGVTLFRDRLWFQYEGRYGREDEP